MSSQTKPPSYDLLPDSIFSPFLCHFCKSPSDNLKTCSRCKLISYCCIKHQKMHWPVHQKVCRAISVVLKKFNASSVFEVAQDEQCWVSRRSLAMCLTETVLKESLSPLERQMFLFPAACALCKSLKIDKSLTCKDCNSVSYCSSNHKTQHEKDHFNICGELKLCFNISCEMAKQDYELSLGLNKILELKTENEVLLPQDISMFISKFVPKDKFSTDCTKFYSEIVSEMFTCLTTIIYAIEKGDLLSLVNKNLNIMMIGCETMTGLESYLVKYIEIIPHWFLSLEKIDFTFVSPIDNSPDIPNLCSECHKRGVSLHFYTQLYHDFVLTSDYNQPDIIFVFNCGFHEKSHSETDTWINTIPKLYDSKHLTVLTSYNSYEAQKDFERFKELKPSNKSINVIMQSTENPFKSIRPHRDWESESIFYQNNFISIVQIKEDSHLKTSSGVG